MLMRARNTDPVQPRFIWADRLWGRNDGRCKLRPAIRRMANALRASIRKGDMAMYPIKQSSGRTKGPTMFGLLLLLAPTSITLIETAEAAAAKF